MAYDPEYARAWRAAHPGYHKAWAAGHPGYFKNRSASWAAAHPEYASAYGRSWAEAHVVELLFTRAKHRAARLDREFTITPADIVVPEGWLCPILGVEMKVRTPYAPTLDRRDNSKGYVPGNVWVISRRANAVKHAAPIEELAAVVRRAQVFDAEVTVR